MNEHLLNYEDMVKSDSSDSEYNVSHVACSHLACNIRINHSYVIIEYEKEFFPGLVIYRNGKNYEVSTMATCTPQGLNWKWPEKDDKIWKSKKFSSKHKIRNKNS